MKRICIGLMGFILGIQSAILAVDFPLLSEAYDVVSQDFVTKNLSKRPLEYGAIRGLMKSIGDPHARFLTPLEFRRMQDRQQGKIYGIGIELKTVDGKVMVRKVWQSSPADDVGLQPGDVIEAIDGKPIVVDSMVDLLESFRAAYPVPIDVTYVRNGKTEVVSIQREALALNAVSDYDIFFGSIGYLRISSFEGALSYADVSKRLISVMGQEIKTLVLDLRFNSGGPIQNAIKIASLFIPQRSLVYSVVRDGVKYGGYTKDNPWYKDGPIYILINEETASSAEIFTAALMEYGRATVLGTPSMGKSSVQTVQPLSDGSAIIFTSGYYFTPLGKKIMPTGIKPDIAYPSDFEVPEPMKKLKLNHEYDGDKQLIWALYTADIDVQSGRHKAYRPVKFQDRQQSSLGEEEENLLRKINKDKTKRLFDAE